MSFHRYQVNFDEAGNAQSPILLPDEPPKKRTIIVRAKTTTAATAAAKTIYAKVD